MNRNTCRDVALLILIVVAFALAALVEEGPVEPAAYGVVNGPSAELSAEEFQNEWLY